MKLWIVALLVIVLGAAGWYYYDQVYLPEQAAEAPVRPSIEAQPRVEPVTPEPREPVRQEPVPDVVSEPAVEMEEPAEPLPALAASDDLANEVAGELLGDAAVMQYVVPDAVISRMVATVDALTSSQVPAVVLPVQAVEGDFEATSDESPEFEQRTPEGDLIPQYVLDPANYARYTAYVERLEAIDVSDAVENYRRLYPLFQQAWRDQGYTDDDFNGRLLAVIEELLETPQPAGPIRLTKPEAVYLYRDPDLEALSAGQKTLIRMGPDNAARVKAWLREFRSAIGDL
jgi:hypothetical protein